MAVKIRKSKKNPNPNQNQNPKNADSVLETESVNDGSESVEVESHTVSEDKPGGFLKSLAQAGDTIGLWDDEKPSDKKETRGRKTKSKSSGQDDLFSLATALITLLLSISSIPHEIKPNDSEITIFSKHLTSIMIRHLPIAGKFSADGMDIIGMLVILSSWYARVQPALKEIRSETQPAPAQEYKQDAATESIPVDSAYDWLQAAASKATPL